MTEGQPLFAAAPLFTNDFQLRERIQIAGAADGSLGRDQLAERQAPDRDPEHRHHDRLRKKRVIRASAGELAQQVERAQTRDQREVVTSLQGRQVEPERKTRRGSAKIRIERRNDGDQGGKILRRWVVKDIEIGGESCLKAELWAVI